MLSLLFLFVGLVFSAAPIYQDKLQEWWLAAGQLRMGESAYRVSELDYQEGVCDMQLREGILIPVYSGKAPISERMIGLLFVGEGELSVSFPDRSDAWGFANHMVRNAGVSWDEMAPIAQQIRPYSVGIDRALLLSADPDVAKLIYDLEPVGSGVIYTEIKDGEGTGVDASYVVTEKRGKLKAQAISVNVLADRTDLLRRIGLDPRSMLRMDRFLSEELRFPGAQLRSVMDFRTKQRYHVAAQDGTVMSNMAYDRWLTCLRDARDQANTGYESLVFSHGFDIDKRRHFQRFSRSTSFS